MDAAPVDGPMPKPLPEPLRGVHIVDLGQQMAGPAAAKLLADNGAEVVHVRFPGQSWWSAEVDENLNRTKRRVQLDPHDEEDLHELHELVRLADVVIEDSAPGALVRFGLDHEAVRRLNPSVVYLSLPGFASTDEEHPGGEASEGVIASATGQFADMGVSRRLMGVEASYSPLPLGSSYAAIFGAIAVTLALRSRLQHGGGDRVEVPIASSLLEGLSYNVLEVDNLPPRYLSRREVEIGRRVAEGIPMGIGYDELTELLDPFYRAYWCADGRPFYVVAVGHRRHPRRVLEVLGLYDEAVTAGVPMFDPYLSTRDWPDDCTIYGHPMSTSWAGWVSSRVATVIATRTSGEWEELFAEHQIPATAHRTTQEWLALPHALESGLLVQVDDERTGRTLRPGPVSWLESATKSSATAWVQSPRTSNTGGWLDDITIIDMTNVIAGPTIAGTLARFGARIIKVDPVEPTFDPWNTILCGLQSNRGKESVLLDAGHVEGRAALRQLIARADVVTLNASPRQVSALGLSQEELAQFAPGTILCELDAWSGPYGGPWRNRSGYDDLVQAASGIAARFGGGLDSPEEHAHFGTIDVLGGLAGALAAALALYARQVDGTVHAARTSLAAAGQLLQTPFLYDYEDRAPWDEPSGPQARGEGPTYRLYRASDRWMFVAAPPTVDLSELSTVVAHDLSGMADEQMEKMLSEAFAERPAAQWQTALPPLGVSVQPLQTLTEMRTRNTAVSTSPWSTSSFHFNRIEHHPCGRAVTLVSPVAIRPQRAAIVVPGDAPKYGQHTRAVLGELGYSSLHLDNLLEVGAASESWSEQYLPD